MVILMMMPDVTKSGLCANAHMMMENMHELDERFEWLGRYYGKEEGNAIELASLGIAADLLELQEIALTHFNRPN